MSGLAITNLHVSVEGKEVIKGLDLTIRTGEIHAIMGPNGSGKSSLCKVVMGHPSYEVTTGSVLWTEGEIPNPKLVPDPDRGSQIPSDAVDIFSLSPDKRAQLGLFLSFQYPRAIPGLTMSHFLRSAYNAVTMSRSNQQSAISNQPKRPLSVMKFNELLKEKMKELHIALPMAERAINEGFSGGEMKKTEMLQMALLEPKIAMLDETDSGLDIDALRLVCSVVKNQFEKTGMGVLLITHYNRILDYITPHFVHVMVDGRIVRSGGPEVAREVEERGYEESKVQSMHSTLIGDAKSKVGKRLKVVR